MAISLIGSPQAFNPAYNPTWWYFDSTKKNEDAFRYVVDLYRRTGPSTTTLIHRYRIAPRPVDGYCGFNPSRVLSSYVTNEIPSISYGTPSNSYVRYDIKVGEEYNVPWAYDDYEFYSNPGSPYNAYVQLRDISGPVAHTFVVEDQIEVTQTDPNPSMPAITGLHTVVAVPDTYTIVIDLVFTTSGPATPGTVQYADNSKTLFPDLYTLTDKSLFSGAIDHASYRTYNQVQFAQTTSDLGQAVSTIPNLFTVRPTSVIALNWFSNYATTAYYIYGQNDAGDVWRRSINDGTVPMRVTPVGPGNINLTTQVSGTGALVQSTTQYYDIWLANSSGVRTSETYRFAINRACTKFDEFECVFVDRLGSLGSFSFTQRHDRDMSVKRETHKYMLGDLSGAAWTYSTYDAGSKNINVDATESYTLSTSWLTDAESLYFREMVSSPTVWLGQPGSLFAAIVETSSIKVQRRPQDKRVSYTVKFLMGSNNIINI